MIQTETKMAEKIRVGDVIIAIADTLPAENEAREAVVNAGFSLHEYGDSTVQKITSTSYDGFVFHLRDDRQLHVRRGWKYLVLAQA